MNANIFKPAMAAMVVAIAATGLVACNGTGDKSEPLSKITEPAAAATAEPATAATPAPPDSAATTPDSAATTTDSTAKSSDTTAKSSDTTASTDAQPANSSPTMTAKEKSTAMPMQGQANDQSTTETKPVPKN